MPNIDGIKMWWRFAWGFRKFISEPITVEQSHEIVKQRLANRERNLLAFVKQSIFSFSVWQAVNTAILKN